MNDMQTTVRELEDLVLTFSKERDWERFHHPKDLGVALACEVGELLEHFRYKSDAEVRAAIEEPKARRAVAHELADCFWLILRLAQVCGVDLAAALEEKVALAAIKYPVDKSYGRSDKYTSYQSSHETDAS